MKCFLYTRGLLPEIKETGEGSLECRLFGYTWHLDNSPRWFCLSACVLWNASVPWTVHRGPAMPVAQYF